MTVLRQRTVDGIEVIPFKGGVLILDGTNWLKMDGPDRAGQYTCECKAWMTSKTCTHSVMAARNRPFFVAEVATKERRAESLKMFQDWDKKNQ